jgi:hypothetical protein
MPLLDLSSKFSAEPLANGHVYQYSGAEGAVPTRGLLSLEKAASDREIRALLGQRLREQYNIVQQVPVSERLSKLIERLVQRLEGRQSEPE